VVIFLKPDDAFGSTIHAAPPLSLGCGLSLVFFYDLGSKSGIRFDQGRQPPAAHRKDVAARLERE
jgi:hypothetical protein